MRQNLPVNSSEYIVKPGSAIISRTDKSGRIVHCNDEFVEASGFERKELIGEHHNIVRHPDMPPEAFRDMWATLKSGRAWSGLVKNRRKDGGFYWVRANATPLPDGSGYMSVRTAPTSAERREAEALYQTMRTSDKFYLDSGVVRKRGIIDSIRNRFILARLWQNSGTTRLITPLIVLGFIFAGVCLWAANALQTTSVDGYRFHKISLSSVLLADILPPPAYIIESYLTTLEMTDAQSSELSALKTKLRRLQSEFEERHQYWSQTLEAGPLADTLLTDSYQPAKQFYQLAFNSYIPALEAGNLQQANDIKDNLKVHYQAHRKAIDSLVNQTNAWADRLVEESRAFYDNSIYSLLIIFLVSIAFASLLSVIAVRSVMEPLKNTGMAAVEIAKGNLLARLPDGNLDEVGKLVSRLAIMRNNLHEIAASLRQEASHMTDNLTSLGNVAEQSSSSAAKQADSASSLAAAIEELSISIGHISTNTNKAHDLSDESSRVAEHSGETITTISTEIMALSESVTSTAGSISELESLAGQITSIVDVIGNISDQTNLLALNAAIEAARAGDAGRGFSVVADEVRGLAERTGTSTKEITAMIDKVVNGTSIAVNEMNRTVETVKHCANQAKEAGGSVKEISDSNHAVLAAMEQVKQGLQEQSIAAREIAERIEIISEESKTNASSASGMRKTSTDMAELASNLQALTNRFVIA